MENIAILLLCVLTSKIYCQISLAPGQKCKIRGSINPLVVGGINITAEDAPWNTVLELKSKAKYDRIVNHCGGSILSRTIILTAAHCVWENKIDPHTKEHLCPEYVRKQESARDCHKLPKGCPANCTRVRPEDINVYVGVTSITQAERIPLKVKNIIIHPGWNKRSSMEDALRNGHDLAIIVLKTKLKFNSKVRHICLPDEQHRLRSGQYVDLNGLGYTDGFGERPAECLQHGRLQIKTKEECTAYWSKGQILGDQLCTYSSDTGSCHGDSGSGLVKFMGSIPVLVGTVSFGHILCKYRPGVYTNVQSHLDWIQQKMINISTNPGKECVTISGPSAGLPCVFPFTYQGKRYSSCIMETSPDGEHLWCPTKVDAQGNYKEGHWGRCQKACTQEHPRRGKECVTISGPSAGFPCVFPFTYLGKKHSSCIMETSPDGEHSWCPTKVDAQGNYKERHWGRCQTSCTQEHPRSEFHQTSRRCSEKETCEARQTCTYVQQKYKEALEAGSKEQQKNIINKLRSRICNKQKKAFCCPEN